MKGILLTLLVLLAATCSASEETTSKPSEEDYTDVVLLNNNGTITGKILEIIPGKEVRIERIDGQEFTVPFKRIFAVTDTDNLEQRRQEFQMHKPDKSPLDWRNVTMVGFRHCSVNDRFSASTVNGVALSEHIFVGLGLGWDSYPQGNIVPVFANGRYSVQWGFVRPFAYVDAGYAFGWLWGMPGADFGGLTVGVGLGMKLAVDDGTMPLLQLGFRSQQTKTGRRETETLNFCTVMIGLSI